MGSDAGVRHALKVVVASFALPVYRELERRIKEFEKLTLDGVAAPGELRRLCGSLRDVERFVVVDVRMVCECIREVPSIAVFTHLVSLPLRKWAEYLIGVQAEEDGGLMSRAERRHALETCVLLSSHPDAHTDGMLHR